MAAVNISAEAVVDKIPELREKFKAKFADQISAGTYDDRDIKRLDTDDAYAACFLRTLLSNGDADKALVTVDECFKFRKAQKLHDLTSDSFPEEVKAKNAIYYKGTDVNGHPILYVDVKANNLPANQIDQLKQYIAYSFEQHHGKHPDQMCVVIFDMYGASTTSVSLDITKYIIKCFTHYFPAFLAYLINYEMPLILLATWKIINTFLTSGQKKKMIEVKKKDITKYIPEEHLWPHMK